MMPVILTLLPNSLQFVGSFDTENVNEWWLSTPLPGAIEKIVSNCWVGGSIHVAVCLMLDGTYSIYQSLNYGKDWREVYNTADIIYDVDQIDYGWILVSTSGGWLESTNSADSFHTVSTQAPGCKTVVNIGENILMAHDGDFVWKSTNIARDWTKILDVHYIEWLDYHDPDQDPNRRTAWNGDSYPALAGVWSRVLVGAGPYLVITENRGTSWTMPYWYMANAHAAFPEILPYSQHRIMQILHTGTLGNGPEDNMFMLKIHHRHDSDRQGGESIVRHYYATNIFARMYPRFDQFYSEAIKNQMTAYQVLRVGSSFNDQIVFSGQTRYDTVLGRNVPSLKVSENGGWDWLDVDLANITVLPSDPSQEPSTGGGAFLNEYGIFSTWIGHPCHNSGRWKITTENWVRSLSYDIDMLIVDKPRDKPFYGNMKLVNRVLKEFDLDTIIKLIGNPNYNLDVIIKKVQGLSHYHHLYVMKSFDETANADIVLVDRVTLPYLGDALVKKAQELDFTANILNRGISEHDFGINIILRKDYNDDLMRDLELDTPQLWDITAPLLCRRRLGDLGETGEET